MKIKNLKNILGQKPAVNLLKLALEKDRLSHAYLFTGPRGVGKSTTAWAFLFHLFCKNSRKNPCGECSACKKLEKETHPDIFKIAPEKQEITIKQIREINSFIRYRPVEGEYKIIFLENAEKMNPEASNALLKSLEEPPSFVIFFLITENFTRLLPTIISRSQVVRFRLLPSEVIKNFLKKNYWFEDKVAETLAEISQGSLGRAIEIAEKGVLEELNAFVKAGYSDSVLKKFKAVERISGFKHKDLEEFLFVLSVWVWRSYLNRKLNLPYPPAFPEETFSGDPYTALKFINHTRSALERYAHSELTFYNLMLKLFSIKEIKSVA